MGPSVDLLRALTAIKRIEILDALRDGPKNVSQLVACDLGHQAGLSKHLQILLGCGLVDREKKGRQAVYSIPPIVQQLCVELDAVTKCALQRRLGQ